MDRVAEGDLGVPLGVQVFDDELVGAGALGLGRAYREEEMVDEVHCERRVRLDAVLLGRGPGHAEAGQREVAVAVEEAL